MTIIKTLAVAGTIAMITSGGAFAKTISTVLTKETCSISDTDPTSDACYGVVWTEDAPGAVNDSEDLLNNATYPGAYDSVKDWMTGTASTGIFGHDDWSFLAKDEKADGVAVDGLSFTIGDASTAGMDGTWSWDGPLYDEMVLVLKQGATFAAYLFEDASDIVSGEWMTTSAFDLTAGDLSHMSIYGRMSDVPPVPVPAAGFLLVAGLGGLAALRRRK